MTPNSTPNSIGTSDLIQSNALLADSMQTMSQHVLRMQPFLRADQVATPADSKSAYEEQNAKPDHNNAKPTSTDLAIMPTGVLIVEDDPFVAELLSDLLKAEFGEACPIRAAESIAGATLELQNWTKCDTILIDQILPDGLGAEFLQVVSERWSTRAAILVTGNGSEGVAVRAFQAGARDYLNKAELDSEKLAIAVRRSLKQVRSQQHVLDTAQELKKLRGEMDHFLRAISHDMGANLMILEGAVEVLKQDAKVEPERNSHEGFEHMEAVLRQSNKFMMDLVTLARTGTIEMQPEQVEPTEIARQIASEQRRLLGERKIELLISEGLPAVMVHPARLKQVMTNLVRNAAKHGCAKESPRIEIRRCDPTGLDQTLAINNFVWLAVHDNGAGIPASDRAEIFLPGKRLANAHADGTGMGLAIVKKIVDHYGGHVLVDPRVAIGTSIMFSLPGA